MTTKNSHFLVFNIFLTRLYNFFCKNYKNIYLNLTLFLIYNIEYENKIHKE